MLLSPPPPLRCIRTNKLPQPTDVRGAEYNSFQAAAVAQDLLESGEWDKCLDEAAVSQTGHQIRQLFGYILSFNQPAEPLALFNRHLPQLEDGLAHHLHVKFNIAQPSPVVLKSYNETLEKFHLRLPGIALLGDILDNQLHLIANQLNHDMPALHAKSSSSTTQ